MADHQVALRKRTRAGRTVAEAHPLDGAERPTELSRMLSGRPGSALARDHAVELLALADRERRRPAGPRLDEQVRQPLPHSG
jgi:DNA repair ATPase RecN